MLKRFLSFLLCLVTFNFAYTQNNGALSGSVIDKNTQQPLRGVNITLAGTNLNTISNEKGSFRLQNIPSGTYQLKATAVGYADYLQYNLVVTSGNEIILQLEMEPKVKEIEEIIIRGRKRTARAATLETPLSVQKLTAEEIRSNPGGNFDISRVIQSLPGVGGTAGSVGGFRNDIIIRGGAPNEHVFYLDGIEIPIINHFATQGSAGGPTGILNVSFLEDVKLSSSAFDARYDNALSSVFQFRQKEGNPRSLQGNFRLSATEMAGTLEGPLNAEGTTTFLASVRRSYLQFLFQALDVPIRPNYWDFQGKVTHKFKNNNTLTFIGVGAIDDFSFGKPKEPTPEKLYILGSNPLINQWNYTVGIAYKHLVKNGYWNIALSRNTLDNDVEKYDVDEKGDFTEVQSLDIESKETENKLRIDLNKSVKGWKFSTGIVTQLVSYENETYNRIRKEVRDEFGNIVQPEVEVNFTSPLDPFLRMGFFGQAGKRFLKDKLGVNVGIRMDMNTFMEDALNPFQTFSPRIALSYVLTDRWTINASLGRYYKIPPYTILGYADESGVLINKNSKYIRSDHAVAGVEFLPSSSTRFTLEGFYKWYGNYPVSLRDGISLANLGGDFNVLGNEAIVSTGKGRTWGFEFFAQQKLTKRFYGILSYTYFSSQFSGIDNKLIASAWDNNHLLSVTWGYKFPHNWELGLKLRYQGGAPYTPFDDYESRINYLSLGTGVYNYNLLNTLRLSSYNSSDVRIDKKFNFNKWTLDIYLDVVNWYVAKSPAYPQYTFKRTADNLAFETTDGLPVKADGSNAIPLLLKNDDPSVVPTLGFIVEF